MTQITRDISRGQLVRYTFTEDAVADAQSAAVMAILETNDGTTTSTLGVKEHAIPFDFDIVAIAIHSDSARTAGTLTVDATINGTVTGLTAVLNATNTQTHTKRQPRESDRGTKDQRIGCKITTASWTPVAADVIVDIYAIVYLDSI